MAIIEGKPWDTYTKDGKLNPISYTAIGVFGIAEMALEELHKAGQPLTGTNVKALAATFRHVVITAQEAWTGTTSVADAANTRLRGALRSVLVTLPMPFGQPKEAWDEWVAKATKRCSSIVSVAHYVFDGVDDDEPWAKLSAAPVLSVVPEPAAEAAEADAEPAEAEAPAPAARKVRPARRAVKPVPEPVEEAAEEETEDDEFEEAPKAKPEPKTAKITVDDLEFPADDDEDEFAYGA